MHMKKSKILSYILVFALISAMLMPSSAAALTDPVTNAKAIVLVDTSTGNILFSKAPDEKVYPASTTKIMTALLAIEAIENGKAALTDSVTAGSDILKGLSEDGSTAGIVPGETMTLESLLYCTLISSANEACNIIAEHIGGDVQTFVGMMNSRAKELGCTGTNFTNTHGLPDYNHYTTATDLAKISLEAYTHPLFMEICNTVTKSIPATNISGERITSNTNGLINNDSELYPGYYYEYAKGMKTGHTKDAGYCLVSSATKDNVSMLCVVMGGIAIEKVEKVEYTNFTDSIAVYNWAFENFSYRDIIETTDMVKDVSVKMGQDADYVTVRPATAVKALMPNDEDISSFEQQITIYSEKNGELLSAPIEAGAVLGEISISRDGVIFGTSKLVACSSVEVSYSQLIRAKVGTTLTNPAVIIFLLLVFGLLGTYIFLVMRYRRSKKKYMKEMEMRRKAREKTLADRQTGRSAAAPRARQTSAQSDSDDAYRGEGLMPASERQGRNESLAELESKAEREYFDEFFGRDKK
ncbi:MAG: D-alanyl-D-alanine carboxypeptidase [Firmicutes bacterium HGW-Firmicutes-16]|nr:MAG: D-alanyl-D-alanine carboxypeptidase [Firmicutes bacterium HGW-Firmicutes-16]